MPYNYSDDEYEDSYDNYPVDQDTSESSERSSPDEHTVKGHGQRYHYKDGILKTNQNECKSPLYQHLIAKSEQKIGEF